MRPVRPVLLAILALAGVFAPDRAAADAGFLLPNVFAAADGDPVTLVASFSDRFPAPDTALASDRFVHVGPDGKDRPFVRTEPLTSATILEATLEGAGIHAFSTGERLGRTGEVALVEGRYVRLGPDGENPASVPEDAPRLASQTATVSETRVAVGRAVLPSVIATTGRLALRLETGPGGFVPGEPFAVRIDFDGEPLSNTPVFVIEAHDDFRGLADGRSHATDESGTALAELTRPGPFVVLVRHIAPAPEGAATDVRSYSTTLTLPAVLPGDSRSPPD